MNHVKLCIGASVTSLILLSFCLPPIHAQDESPPRDAEKTSAPDVLLVFARYEIKPAPRHIEAYGTASYPDRTRIHLFIRYHEMRHPCGTVEVENGKFQKTVAPRKELIPSYYEVDAIFYPTEQTDALFKRLSGRQEQSASCSILVGTETEAAQARKDSLEFISRSFTGIQESYDELRALFLKVAKGEPLPRGESPDDRIRCWKERLGELRRDLLERRRRFLFLLFPAIEDTLVSATDFLLSTLDEFTAFLTSPEKMFDTHTGREVSPEELVQILDNKFARISETITLNVNLKQNSDDENYLRHVLSEAYRLYQCCVQNYELAKGSRADYSLKWWTENFRKRWNGDLEDMRKQMAGLDGLALAEKNPSVVEDIRDLPADLLSLFDACTEGLAGSDETREKLRDAEAQFRKRFSMLAHALELAEIVMAPVQPREHAAEALSELQAPPGLEKWVRERMESLKVEEEVEGEDQPREALMALVSLGKVALPYLLEGFDSPDPRVAAWSARGLGYFREKEIFDKLIARFKELCEPGEEATDVRPPETREPSTAPPEVPASETGGSKARSADERIRVGIAEALGRMENPEAIPLLTESLSDESASVREECARSLGLLGDLSAVDAVLELLTDKETRVAVAAKLAIERLTESYVAFDAHAPLYLRNREVEEVRSWWDDERRKREEEKRDADVETPSKRD